MRVVITGATGNIGTALAAELLVTPGVDEVTGLSRRVPSGWLEDVRWRHADVTTTDLVPLLKGADAVVHLSWLMQPSHRQDLTWRTNVEGTKRLLAATAEAGVGAVVVSSSVGAYSPRRGVRPVDESWPTDGVPTAAYSREKAYVERLLDVFEQRHPDHRVVRIRPAFVFQKQAAIAQRRLFAGPLLPARTVARLAGLMPSPARLPFVPDLGTADGLKLQTVHAADAARAFRQAVVRPVRGAFNVAAEPVVDLVALARRLGVPTVRVPVRLARTALASAWAAHLMPVEPGLLDLLAQLPVMSTARAQDELDWAPHLSSTDALEALLTGLEEDTGGPTPPLARDAGGRLRGHEFGTGVGNRP